MFEKRVYERFLKYRKRCLEFVEESYNIKLVKYFDRIDRQEDYMKKNCYRIMCMIIAALLLGGCGTDKTENDGEQKSYKEQDEPTTELEEVYLSAEEDEYVPTITEVFSEATPYQELADFLTQYYEIPEEYRSETRYYYNYIDLNDDGLMEIFAAVIGEYTESSSGDPAVILSVGETGEFVVIEAFSSIRTPITISEQTANGWHDIIYYAYGGEEKDGYRICHYNPTGGYQTEISEIVDALEPVGGTQILSNNLIDDMDQGRYLTLAPKTENAEK